MAAHTFDGVPTLNGDEGGGREKVPVGTPVRIRLVNTDSFEQTFTVSGTPFRVLAIDGTDLHGPGELRNVAIPVAAGGRVDLGYVQPANGVRVAIEGTEVGARARPERWACTGRGDADERLRPADVRHAGTHTVRCQLDRSTAASS